MVAANSDTVSPGNGQAPVSNQDYVLFKMMSISAAMGSELWLEALTLSDEALNKAERWSEVRENVPGLLRDKATILDKLGRVQEAAETRAKRARFIQERTDYEKEN